MPPTLVHLWHREHAHEAKRPQADATRKQHVPERLGPHPRDLRRSGARDGTDQVCEERVPCRCRHERVRDRIHAFLTRDAASVSEDGEARRERQLLERCDAREVGVHVHAAKAVEVEVAHEVSTLDRLVQPVVVEGQEVGEVSCDQLAVIVVSPQPKRPATREHACAVLAPHRLARTQPTRAP